MVPALLAALLLLQEVPASGPGPRADLLGPEDVLRVTVYGHADLTHTVVVEADGTFVFPLIGSVSVDGLTVQELEQSLTRRLADGYIREPRVTVVIERHRSRSVMVMGEITRPGTYALSDARTLVEVLSRAGPPLATAGTEVVVVHAGAAGEAVRVDMERLQGGEPGSNLKLEPGDTVFVPRAPQVFVTGRVQKPGSYALRPGTTVRQAIGLAGGFERSAATGRVRILRQVDGQTRELSARLDDVLRAGDTIVVGKRGLF